MPTKKRSRQQVTAVLYAHGAAAPTNRVRYASFGAGVVAPGTVALNVEIVTEAAAALNPGQKRINLTRFAPGTAVPAYYRLITEKAPE